MWVVGCAVLSVSMVQTASAQYQRSGFWILGGAGGASGSVDLEGFIDSKTLGISGFVAGGGSISSSVMLGMEATGWRATAADTTQQAGMFLAVALFYPSKTLPIYIKGGAGLASVQYDRLEQGVPIRYKGDGIGTELGLGADFRVSEKFQVGAFFNWAQSTVESTRNQLPLVTTNIKISLLQFGASLKYQTVR
jgi:hypothetical protein